ncbi:hypothetical protein DIPPA_16148 [Diplonema papillatum]|nr:hypothetical protein DIPPA_16148 [Diplonema papillatum]
MMFVFRGLIVAHQQQATTATVGADAHPRRAKPPGVKEFRTIFDAVRDHGAAPQILGEFLALLRTSSMRTPRAHKVLDV